MLVGLASSQSATCGHSVFERGGCGIQRSCGAGGSACDPTEFCFGTEPFVINDKEDLVTLNERGLNPPVILGGAALNRPSQLKERSP